MSLSASLSDIGNVYIDFLEYIIGSDCDADIHNVTGFVRLAVANVNESRRTIERWY